MQQRIKQQKTKSGFLLVLLQHHQQPVLPYPADQQGLLPRSHYIWMNYFQRFWILLRSKERGFEMYKHQEQFLKVTQGFLFYLPDTLIWKIQSLADFFQSNRFFIPPNNHFCLPFFQFINNLPNQAFCLFSCNIINNLIEGEARIKAMQQRIKQQKTEILTALNMDELFSKVLNLASQ